MIRVAHFVSKMDIGGIENLLMDIYREIDKSKIQFDFIVNVEDKGYYDDEIKGLGGKIYYVPRKKDGIYKHLKSTFGVLIHEQYDIIHRHGSNSQMFIELLVGKIVGIKYRIAHSHSTRATGNQISHNIFRKLLTLVSTKNLSSSKEAGVHLFGDNNFEVIFNGIDIKKYQFSQELRTSIRNELKIDEDTIVIGNVGRFVKAKNHTLLLEIFKEYLMVNNDAVLVLLGSGEEKKNIENYAQTLEISKKVKFLGLVDAQKYYNIMDCFVMTSVNEGFGIVMLEAQANGLPTVSKKGVINNQIYVLDTNIEIQNFKKLDLWVSKLPLEVDVKKRSDRNLTMRSSNFDIASVVKIYQNLYLGMVGKEDVK